MNLIKEVAIINKLPRAANIGFPFGSPVGNPGDEAKQLEVLMAVLILLESIKEPGTIEQLPFRWK
jgi:hypothetical protein